MKSLGMMDTNGYTTWDQQPNEARKVNKREKEKEKDSMECVGISVRRDIPQTWS